MKRIIASLICFMVLSSLFAATAELKLTTTVEGETLIKLSELPISNGNGGGNGNGWSWGNGGGNGNGNDNWNEAPRDLSLTFNRSQPKRYAFVNLKTNSHSVFVVDLSGGPLTSPNVTTKIGYTISPTLESNNRYESGEDLIVTTTDLTASITPFMTFTNNHGNNVISAEFSVELNVTDWDNANAGDYSTYVTFTLRTV